MQQDFTKVREKLSRLPAISTQVYQRICLKFR
jgi:hypothetical protein